MADDMAAARERLAEQLMSDERVLGALPEDLTRLVLDHALKRLDAAAASARSESEFAAAGEAIRLETRALVDRAAESDKPEAVVRAALAASEATMSGGDARPATEAPGASPASEPESATQQPRPQRSWLPWGRSRRRPRFWW